ncbi:MAG: hypothetical protein FD118_4239 [Rhodocyclaceae bacterium]|nr:MAG: hypothetical protein FD118_4239 [Rhodocyclaceae bacterium]
MGPRPLQCRCSVRFLKKGLLRTFSAGMACRTGVLNGATSTSEEKSTRVFLGQVLSKSSYEPPFPIPNY